MFAVVSCNRALLLANFVRLHTFVLVTRSYAFVSAWKWFIARHSTRERCLIAWDRLALLVFSKAVSGKRGRILKFSIKFPIKENTHLVVKITHGGQFASE